MTHKLPPAIYAIQFVVLMSFSSLAVLNLLPLYLQHLGGSPRQIGLFVGLFSFAAFAARPLGGWLLSRIEPRKILIGGLYLQLVMTGLYLTMDRLNVYAGFIRMFHGFGMSLFILAALLLTINLTEREQRTHALGVVSSGFMIPLLVLPFIGEGIIVRFGFQPFFLLAVVLALVPAVFALFMKFPAVPLEEKVTGSFSGLAGLLFRRRILAIVGLTLLFEIALSSFFSFVPLLTHTRSAMLSGFFYSSLALMAVFLRLYAGQRLRFWGSPFLLIPAFICLSAGGILLYFSRMNGHLVLAGLIAGLGTGILYPHLSALVVDRISSRERSLVLGFFAAFVDLGFALGPVLFGSISQWIGIRRTFSWFGGGLLLLSALLLLYGRRDIFGRD